MAEADADRISQLLIILFMRFYRVDKLRARSSGVSGIGLTIARHLVEAHNGRIWAESEGRERGSQFMFWLPLNSTTLPTKLL